MVLFPRAGFCRADVYVYAQRLLHFLARWATAFEMTERIEKLDASRFNINELVNRPRAPFST